MLGYITLIFTCQLIGELVVAALGLPMPGPVVGMILLLTGLIVRGSVPGELAAAGDFLLSNLSLLFVPAAVGVIVHAGLLARDWLPLTIALIVSTLAAIAVSALIMQWLSRSSEQ